MESVEKRDRMGSTGMQRQRWWRGFKFRDEYGDEEIGSDMRPTVCDLRTSAGWG